MRYRVSKGIQQAAELERKEKLSTEIWVRQQERMGLDVLVDGEMYRSDLINYFAKRIDGFSDGGIVRSYGNRFTHKPIIKSKIEWKGQLILDHWKYAQRLTHKPVKAVLTGPYTLMSWTFNEYYESRETLCRDLTHVLTKESGYLIEAGAKIIQIDELAIPGNATELSLAMDALKELLKKGRAYYILRLGVGDMSLCWPQLRKLPVQNFHIEMINSNFRALPTLRKFPTDKDLTVGVVNSHNHAIETPKDILAHVKQVRKVLPAHRIWLSTDAGLKTRTVDEAIGKLTSLANAAVKSRTK